MSSRTPDQWREFLIELSRVLLLRDEWSGDEANRPNFSPEARAAGYVGFEGASEAELLEVEARLGVKLPLSYRAFLQVSNGWPSMWGSTEPGQLWGTGQIR